MSEFTKEELLIILDDVNIGINKSGFAATRFYVSISEKIQSMIENYEENRKKQQSEQEELLFLQALQEAGVDNWSGYEMAHEIYEELKGES